MTDLRLGYVELLQQEVKKNPDVSHRCTLITLVTLITAAAPQDAHRLFRVCFCCVCRLCVFSDVTMSSEICCWLNVELLRVTEEQPDCSLSRLLLRGCWMWGKRSRRRRLQAAGRFHPSTPSHRGWRSRQASEGPRSLPT